MQPSKTILKNRLNLPDLSGNNYKKRYWSICKKKTWESLFYFRNRRDWTIFFQLSRFQCPHCKNLILFFPNAAVILLNGTNDYAEEK